MDFEMPRRLNHVVYVTRDTKATIEFYRDVMGMRLISCATGDEVPSTMDKVHFLHTFFQMKDGSCIAFFEIEDLPEETAPSVIPKWAPHLALSVDSEAELQDALHHLKACGIDVIGPVDHEEGTWQSLYFFDPNGVRLEITYQSRELTDDDASRASKAVEEWLAEHGKVHS